MRISDWSSDVCSSDLGEVKKRARFPGPSPHETGRPDEQQAAINVPSHWAYMKTLNYPDFFRKSNCCGARDVKLLDSSRARYSDDTRRQGCTAHDTTASPHSPVGSYRRLPSRESDRPASGCGR